MGCGEGPAEGPDPDRAPSAGQHAPLQTLSPAAPERVLEAARWKRQTGRCKRPTTSARVSLWALERLGPGPGCAAPTPTTLREASGRGQRAAEWVQGRRKRLGCKLRVRVRSLPLQRAALAARPNLLAPWSPHPPQGQSPPHRWAQNLNARPEPTQQALLQVHGVVQAIREGQGRNLVSSKGHQSQGYSQEAASLSQDQSRPFPTLGLSVPI